MGKDAASRAREQTARPSPMPHANILEDPLDEWANGAKVQDGYEIRGRVRETQGRWAEAAEAYEQALMAVEAMGEEWVDREVVDSLRQKRDAAKLRAAQA